MRWPASCTPSMYRSRVERFIDPACKAPRSSDVRSTRWEAAVTAMPTGVLISWAMPATRPPRAASFSDSTIWCCMADTLASASDSSRVRSATFSSRWA